MVRLTNPMDLGDLFDLEVYGALAQGVLAMPEVDGMVLLHTYEAGLEGPRSEELFRRLHQISQEADKPLAVYANTAAAEITRLKGVLPGPIFDEPADAVQALAMRRDLGRGTVADAGAARGACRRRPECGPSWRGAGPRAGTRGSPRPWRWPPPTGCRSLAGRWRRAPPRRPPPPRGSASRWPSRRWAAACRTSPTWAGSGWTCATLAGVPAAFSEMQAVVAARAPGRR